MNSNTTKDSRKVFTDAVKLFVEYAINQGSKNSNRYYINFSVMAKNCAGIKDINKADQFKIDRLRIVYAILANTITDKINLHKNYKDIFKEIKALCSLIQKGWANPIVKIEYEQISLVI